ncbi:MAG TPA: NAD(P)/FAD-dependent oxidoreductase [Terracidiphilus sp.]|nr:NAD(P)/FAD-dependent oxidoreductase [Terracidiphilus sp.]
MLDGPMPAAPRQFDVIVLGAGAAGLMCAAVAGQRGRRVALLEHNAQPGRKILISGGGRCNFTNIHCTAANFLSRNPHFAKSALAGYQPRHFLELVERYGIRWHEKTLGQLFCDHSAMEILQMLLAECDKGGVERIWNARGAAVERDSGGFRVASSAGEFTAGALVMATGGLSIPAMGATGFGYELARQFGLAVVEPRPALVPLVLAGEEAGWTKLAGVSAEVTARAGSGPAFREKLLVTHRGLSGPAVLQASSYWRAGELLEVDFAPDVKAGELLAALKRPGGRRDEAGLRQALREAFPQRLAGHLAMQLEESAAEGWTNAAVEARELRLHRWRFHPAGTEGFAKAEVTAGGVDTDGLEARTLQARAVPGLFLIGEAVDVTGHLGGFNFQWAWASAVAAGKAV